MKLKIEFTESTHEYRVNGEVWPSVTQCLRDAGMMPDPGHYTPGSADRGTAVHSTIRLYLDAKKAKKKPEEIDAWRETLHPIVRPYFEAFRKFEAESKFRAHRWEQPIANAEYRYAGRYDLYGQIAGRQALIDAKTGGPAPWHGPQLVAYLHGIGNLRVVPDLYGLYLRKDGTYGLTKYGRLSDLHDFLAAVRVAAWRRENGLLRRDGDGDAGHGTGDGAGQA